MVPEEWIIEATKIPHKNNWGQERSPKNWKERSQNSKNPWSEMLTFELTEGAIKVSAWWFYYAAVNVVSGADMAFIPL